MSKKRLILAIGAGALLWSIVIAAATGTLAFSFGVNAWHHQPAMAADAAETFGEVAFVGGDAERAYSLVNPDIEDELALEDFATILDEMHPTGRPDSVRAIEYEPLPGFRGMNIYLEGDAATAKFYYRLLMEGTSTSGYRVTGIWRGSGPYPPSEDRQPIP